MIYVWINYVMLTSVLRTLVVKVINADFSMQNFYILIS